MAHELRTPLRRCMAEHTEEELLLWLAYLDADLDRPSRADYYAMATAAEVRLVAPAVACMFGGKRPSEVKLSDMVIDFHPRPEAALSPEMKRLAAEMQKAAWVGGLGLGESVRERRISKAEGQRRAEELARERENFGR